ncbi:hypothetical protein ABQF34_04950 [Mycolicibacterium boenickei]
MAVMGAAVATAMNITPASPTALGLRRWMPAVDDGWEGEAGGSMISLIVDPNIWSGLLASTTTLWCDAGNSYPAQIAWSTGKYLHCKAIRYGNVSATRDCYSGVNLAYLVCFSDLFGPHSAAPDAIVG